MFRTHGRLILLFAGLFRFLPRWSLFTQRNRERESANRDMAMSDNVDESITRRTDFIGRVPFSLEIIAHSRRMASFGDCEFRLRSANRAFRGLEPRTFQAATTCYSASPEASHLRGSASLIKQRCLLSGRFAFAAKTGSSKRGNSLIARSSSLFAQ